MSPDKVDCCITGAGPGGSMLALLLARQGVSVALLEAQHDFKRDFRGDTLHPSTLEILDEIDLADSLLQLPHSKIRTISYLFKKQRRCVSDFSRVNSQYPYIAILAQAQFLEFIVSSAKRYPGFQFFPGARVTELIEEAGVIGGVRYDAVHGRQEVRALLTIGADGRSSRLRRLAGLKLLKVAPAIHVLWFRLPRTPSEPEEGRVYLGNGNFMIALAGHEYWQLGKVVARKDYHQLRAAGLRSLQQDVATVAPEFAGRINHLDDLKQISTLTVEPARLTRWYRPGLLMIGDSAHVMSPVGGVGINYAIQDAVVAANLLSDSLKSGEVSTIKLQAVQRRREWPTRIIQLLQKLDQREIIDRALDPRKQSMLETMLNVATRSSLIQDLIARLMAIGIWRVHVTS